jgi:hypothetical protein
VRTLPLSSSKSISCWNQPTLTFIIVSLTSEDTSSELLKIYLLLESTGAHFHHRRFNRSAHLLFPAAVFYWKCTDEYTQTNIGLSDVPSSQNSVSGTLLGMHRRLYSLDRRFNWSAHLLFPAVVSYWKCTDEYTQTNISLSDVPSSQNSVSGTLLGMHRRLYSLDRRINRCLYLSFLWVDSLQVLTDFFAELHVDLELTEKD